MVFKFIFSLIIFQNEVKVKKKSLKEKLSNIKQETLNKNKKKPKTLDNLLKINILGSQKAVAPIVK